MYKFNNNNIFCILIVRFKTIAVDQWQWLSINLLFLVVVYFDYAYNVSSETVIYVHDMLLFINAFLSVLNATFYTQIMCMFLFSSSLLINDFAKCTKNFSFP